MLPLILIQMIKRKAETIKVSAFYVEYEILVYVQINYVQIK